MDSINFLGILVAFLTLIVSLTVHEAAHAWSADRLGDPTARLLGRVSFNPAVHVDPIGTIVFPLVAMFTGVPLLGWAKPVPVNTHQLGHAWKRKFMLIAAAGPASNLLLAAIAAVAFRLVGGEPFGPSLTAAILRNAVGLNLVLAVFNMFPVPPLDGGNVLAGLLHGRPAAAFDRLRPYGFVIIYGLMLSGILWSVLSPITDALESILI